jgi:hypothetical protein
MDFLTNMSSPSYMPAFSVHLNNQSGLDLSPKKLHDEANGNSNALSAAGSATSSPLPSTCQPTLPIYNSKHDQLYDLLNAMFSTNINAGRQFGALDPNFFTNDGFQNSTSSPCPPSYVPLDSVLFALCHLTVYLSPPSSSLTSPLGEYVPLPLSSQDQLLYLPINPLAVNELGGQDLGNPAQACQYPTPPLFSPNIISPPTQFLLQPVSLDQLASPDVLSIADQGQQGMGNDLGAPQGNFLTVPALPETTSLGLYYPSTPHIPNISPLPIQVQNTVLVPSSIECAPATLDESRKIRAVVPTPKAPRAKRARSEKARPSAAVTPAFSSASTGTKVKSVLKCKACGFSQSTQRKGDFLRHLNTHSDKKSNRFVCCGVPATHSNAASLTPGYTVRLYKGCEFYGGCGKTYSRMDALQRHLGKSDCVGGGAKDHELWKQLYL